MRCRASHGHQGRSGLLSLLRGVALAPVLVGGSMIWGLWVAVRFVAVFILPFALLRECWWG